MANLIDYIKWRGDIDFKHDKFNEIDNVIMSRLSYYPFDNVIKKNEKITIEQVAKRFEKLDSQKETILQENDIKMVKLMAATNRFKGIYVSDYVSKISKEEQKQFAAITLILPNNNIYVSYRGTDNTIVGWKEDFNMSFEDRTASQISAVKYLEKISKKYDGKIMIGGHSKGGNLAVYAATFCNDSLKSRIIKIYNNDGPGFSEKIISDEKYKKILKKVTTFIPQSSVVGRLLNHEEKYYVVQSTQVGILQHDVYSWELLANNFIHLKDLTNGSQVVNNTIKTWLNSLDVEKRKEFVDLLFEILFATNAKTVKDLKQNVLKNSKVILSTYKNIDEESKKVLSDTIKELMKIAKDNIVQNYFGLQGS